MQVGISANIRVDILEYGGSTDKYTWDQWEDELVINVTFSPDTKGKDVVCTFHKKSLKLCKKGEEPIFDVGLFSKST